MEYNPSKKEIILNKELNNLDRFVLDFINLLDKYVIVSGYVSIILGRTRSTEDIDLLIPSLTKEEFTLLWQRIINKNYWCLNTSNIDEAFDMLGSHAIRFAKQDSPIPNIEFKIIKNNLDKYSYENKIKVVINSHKLHISPLELQIAYKLFLGSNKDIEDAKHIYKLFYEKLNKQELLLSLNKLGVSNEFEKIK